MNNLLVVIGSVVILGIVIFLIVGQINPDSSLDMDVDPLVTINEITDPDDESPRTIVDVAADTPRVSTLVAAITAAGLRTTLANEGPFTVFAPVNEAFASLPAGAIENLLRVENSDELTNILTYHVVSGRLFADDLTDGMELETVNGATITVAVADDGGVSINESSNVINSNIEASNGVIHLIDTVLSLPTE